jgi:hypothetical protein
LTKLQKILGIAVALIAIFGAVYKFDVCKASKSSVEELKMDLANFKLTDYRKELVRRMWAIEREFPTTYMNRTDWRTWNEELRLLDIKIEAYYQRKGG